MNDIDSSSEYNAHAPGSVTTIFAPSVDPHGGSCGVSFAIEDGVGVAVEPSPDSTVFLDGEPTAFEPVERVLRRLDVTAEVWLTPEVPVGYGFGASGAATLATALAVNETYGLEWSREELLESAHLAEVEAGTGLGDVFVQDHGGLVWNTGDGIRRTDANAYIEYTALDGIATDTVLADDRTLERVRTLGQDSLSRFSPDGSLGTLLEQSWEFARRTGLATDRVIAKVQHIEHQGGSATMAMLGETIVATGVQNTLDRSTRITNHGATVNE